MSDLLHSPLHDRHVALGAKLADFGGWEMPIAVSYTHLGWSSRATPVTVE